MYLKTGNGQYDIQLGLHTVDASQYLFSAINNLTDTRTFSIDTDGNAYFAGELRATSGTLDSITANNFSLNTGTISGDVSFAGTVTMTAEGLIASFSNLSTDLGTLTTKVSTVEQTAEGITSEVSSIRDVTGTLTTKVSTIEQTARWFVSNGNGSRIRLTQPTPEQVQPTAKRRVLN